MMLKRPSARRLVPVLLAMSGACNLTGCIDEVELPEAAKPYNVDIATGQGFSVDFIASGLEYSPALNRYFMLDNGSEALMILDADGNVLSKVSVLRYFNTDSLLDIALDDTNDRVYITAAAQNRESTEEGVLVLTTAGKYVDFVRIAQKSQSLELQALAVSPLNGALYGYSDDSEYVVRLNTATGEWNSVFEAPCSVNGMELQNDGSFVLLCEGSSLRKVSATGEEQLNIPLSFELEEVTGMAINAGADGNLGSADDSVYLLEVNGENATEPRNLGETNIITWQPGNNGVFEGTGDDVVARLDISNKVNPVYDQSNGTRAMAYNTNTGTLYLYDNDGEFIYLVQPDGTFVNAINVAPFLPVQAALTPDDENESAHLQPSGLTFDAANDILYITNDCYLYSVSADGSSLLGKINLCTQFASESPPTPFPADAPLSRSLALNTKNGSLYALHHSATSGSGIQELSPGQDGIFGTAYDRLYQVRHNYLSDAAGIAYDANEDALVVVTEGDGQMYWFNEDLTLNRLISLSAVSEIQQPSALVADPATKRFLIADSDTESVYSIAATGNLPLGNVEMTSLFLTSLLLSDVDYYSGNYYLTDSNGESVWVLTESGDFVANYPIITYFNQDSPSGISVDPSTGKMHIAGGTDGGILILNNDGSFDDFIRLNIPDSLMIIDIVRKPDNGDIFLLLESMESVVKVNPADGSWTNEFSVAPFPKQDPSDTDEPEYSCYSDETGFELLSNGNFLFRCGSDLLEVSPTGVVLNTSDALIAWDGNDVIGVTENTETNTLAFVALDESDGDSLALVGINLLSLDIDVLNDGDDTLSTSDISDAFPQAIGTAGGSDFSPLAYVPATGSLFGLFQDDGIIEQISLQGIELSSVNVDPLPNGDNLCIDNDAGMAYDAADDRLLIHSCGTLSSIGRDGREKDFSISLNDMGLESEGLYGLGYGPTGNLLAIRDSNSEDEKTNSAIIEISPGADGKLETTDDNTIKESSYAGLFGARDIVYHPTKKQYLVVTKGNGQIHVFDESFQPTGDIIPLGAYTRITQPDAIDVDPASGDVFINDSELEEIFRISF